MTVGPPPISPTGRDAPSCMKLSSLDMRQDLFDQPLRLGHHLVAGADGSQDEFLDADGDILGNPRADRLGIADRKITVGVLAGAFGVGSHRASDGSIARL